MIIEVLDGTHPRIGRAVALAMQFLIMLSAVASFAILGYGDLHPNTPGGRIFTTFVLFIGLGIIAAPAPIMTTALLEAETNIRKKKPQPTETTKGD